MKSIVVDVGCCEVSWSPLWRSVLDRAFRRISDTWARYQVGYSHLL